MKRFSGLAAALLVSTIAVAPAAAAVVAGSNYAFTFTGTCTDCIGLGIGTLNVQNYVLGQALQTSNFVSFHYDGTNLVSPFTLNSVTRFSGALDTTPGPYTVQFGDGSTSFASSSFGTGGWQLSVPRSLSAADYGSISTWSVADSSAAPEPATWAMLVGGFGLVGGAMRRRQRSAVRFA